MIQEITYTIAAKRIHITKTHRGGLKHRTMMAIFDIFQYFARQPFFISIFICTNQMLFANLRVNDICI